MIPRLPCDATDNMVAGGHSIPLTLSLTLPLTLPLTPSKGRSALDFCTRGRQNDQTARTRPGGRPGGFLCDWRLLWPQYLW